MEKLQPDTWPERFGDYLYSYAYFRISKEEAAKDLVQDTFLSALKNTDTFRGQASEKTWLVSILKNKIIDYYRKASNRLEVSQEDQKIAADYDHFFNAEGEGTEGHWTKENGPAEWTSASSKIESNEFLQILKNCLNKLPEKWSAAFSMKLFEEQNAEEICKEMNLTSSNYWVIMHRARLQLRECLEKNWFTK